MDYAYFVVLIFADLIGLSAGNSEVVWVEASNEEVYLRAFDNRLRGPSLLELRLKRGKDTIKLKLEESVHINANAPLYELTTTKDGTQKLHKKDTKPITNVRFYQDKSHAGTFTVKCHPNDKPGCKRLVNGNFYIDGENYEIYPDWSEKLGRLSRMFSFGYPHVLVRQHLPDDFLQSMKTNKIPIEDGIPLPTEKFNRIALHKKIHPGVYVDDGFPIPDGPDTRPMEKITKDWTEVMLNSKKRQGTEKTTYSVEAFVVIDPALWEQHYARVKATNPTDPDTATEEALREYFSHIMNGVDLRYMSIDDPDIEMFVTLSGFLIIKERGENNPFPPSELVKDTEDAEYADINVFIDRAQKWTNEVIDTDDDDHVFIFSGYTLFDAPSGSTGVIGVAYLSGVCGQFRTSINQEHGHNYLIMTSLAAHELGHNLGANHDEGQSTNCLREAGYIMAPSVTSSIDPDNFTVNPFRFSECSIEGFKRRFATLSNNCLLDHGDFYNETAFNVHVSKLPGEIYSLDEQCRLLQGDQSQLCSSATDETVCSRLWCSTPDGSCNAFAAAPGTSCGQPGRNKWCFEGYCHNRTTEEGTTTTEPTVETTTEPSVETTVEPTVKTTTEPSVETTTELTLETTTEPSVETTTEPTLETTTEPTVKTTTEPTVKTTVEPTVKTSQTTSQTITETENNNPPPGCENIGLHFYNCATMRGWYYDVNTFCKDYGQVCCLTCIEEADDFHFTPTTTQAPQCIDNGFFGYDCQEMQLWYATFDDFCYDNEAEYCCETCRDRKIACQDFGFAGFTCDRLRNWSINQRTFCKSWGKYCCKTCG